MGDRAQSRPNAAPGGRRSVVEDLTWFLAEWQQAMDRRVPPTDPVVVSLRRLSKDLQPRASAQGFGGISRHLAASDEAVDARDLQRLTESLEVLKEMCEQARSELHSSSSVSGEQLTSGPAAAFAATSLAPGGSDPSSVAPPRMVTVGPGLVASRAGPAQANVRTVLSRPDGATPGAPPPLAAGANLASPAANGVAPAPPPPISVRPSEPPAAPQIAPPPVANVDAGKMKTLESAKPPEPSRMHFDVKNAFGLRAFRSEAQPASPPVISSPASPPIASSSAAPLSRSLFGLKSRKASNPRMPSAPPKFVTRDPGGLKPVPAKPQGLPTPKPESGMGQLLNRLGNEPSRQRSTPPRARNPVARRGAHPRAQPSSSAGWILFGAGVLGAGILVLVAVLVFSRRDRAPVDPVPVAGSAARAPASAAVASGDAQQGQRTKFIANDERFQTLVAQIHGRGGKASPELRALLDDEAAVVSKALSGKCGDKSVCDELQSTFVDQKPLTIKKRERDPNRPLSGWLQGLQMPEIAIEDDPRVKRMFEFYTENPVGRETLQSMLFRCGAYRDMIYANLIKYELPKDLIAIVYAESSCSPMARSPVGAVGLWQFMPSSARAYHLHVREDVVDERLNPYKSTEAGVRFMSDLYSNLGSWELVFASYNVGPFGLLARLERAGGDVGFWDLVDNDLLPEETANYVPTIQAIALILNNLRKLRFATSQMRAPRLTAELEVAAGTRLSLIARAAATSTTELKKYNLDLLGENVPQLPGGFSVQVPKDVVWQARDTLKELVSQGDDADLCVSPAFDWGKRQFTQEMAQACHRKLQARAAAPSPSG